LSRTADWRRPILEFLVILFGVFFIPYGYEQTIGLGSANHIIRWPLWTYTSSFYFSGFTIIGWSDLLAYGPYWIMRLLLAFSLIRYYSGIVSRRQTIAIGILSIIPTIVLSSYSFILQLLQPSGFSELLYPIPAFFAVAMLLLHVRPYDDSEKPW
jgi:hypothetical protein